MRRIYQILGLIMRKMIEDWG